MPIGLPLVDGLDEHESPTIEDYCEGCREYIRMASKVGRNSGKAAQIRSPTLAAVAVQICGMREQVSSTRSQPNARLVVGYEA